MLEQVDNFCCCNFKNWSCSLNTSNRIRLKWRTYQFNGLTFFWNVVSLRTSSFSCTNYSKINSMWYWSFTFVKDFQNMYLLHCISTVILMLSDFSFFSTPIIDIWSVILWYEVQVKRIVRPARVKLLLMSLKKTPRNPFIQMKWISQVSLKTWGF